MAIFGSLMAYFFYNYGVSKIEVSESTLYTYLQPVIAIPLSVLFLNEILTPAFIVGSVFILFGLIIAETRK
jgi:drug/metabolite transporter (DMT)-like permease